MDAGAVAQLDAAQAELEAGNAALLQGAPFLVEMLALQAATPGMAPVRPHSLNARPKHHTPVHVHTSTPRPDSLAGSPSSNMWAHACTRSMIAGTGALSPALLLPHITVQAALTLPSAPSLCLEAVCR